MIFSGLPRYFWAWPSSPTEFFFLSVLALTVFNNKLGTDHLPPKTSLKPSQMRFTILTVHRIKIPASNIHGHLLSKAFMMIEARQLGSYLANRNRGKAIFTLIANRKHQRNPDMVGCSKFLRSSMWIPCQNLLRPL